MTSATADLISTAPRRANGAARMSQLDAWRGLAITAVILQHYFPPLIRYLPVGHVGVRLFFVLSGFLITGILLRCRQSIDAGQPALFTFRQFMIRRVLRIFPVYYLCLILALLAGLAGLEVQGLRQSFWWHATYLSNFYFAWKQEWGGIFFHFWSLSVTEQFYVLWPLVILLLPRRAIIPTVLATIAIGFGWKVAASITRVNFFVGHCLPFGAWDSLGIGALMAMAAARPGSTGHRPGTFWRLLLPAGLLLLIVSIVLRRWEDLPFDDERVLAIDLPLDVGSTLLGMWAIRGSAAGLGGPAGAVLSFRPLAYLGTISYGLYIFHPFLIRVVHKAQAALGGVWIHSIIGLLLLAIVAVPWCAACWHLLESPINNLKKYFPYDSRQSGDGQKGQRSVENR